MVNRTFELWMSGHIRFLREIISGDETSYEVVKTWWVFFCDIFMSVEKFGLMINGRITGLKFNNLEIKGIKHE